jgi:DNA (cytosine-5)-methyltransferase 1
MPAFVKQPIFIDLFAGAGGLSSGLSDAGFKCVYANEFVGVFAETYMLNHPGTIVSTQDVRSLEPERILAGLGLAPGELDLLAGGPPCQGYSINAPSRSAADERNHLFLDYLRFVEAFQPRVVLIENVPGLVSFEHGATLQAIIDSLGKLGYEASVQILGAAYYGIPQMRWRTVIIGTRESPLPPDIFPDPACHAPALPNFKSSFNGESLVKKPDTDATIPFVTVREAIGDLPRLANGERGAARKEYPTGPQSDYQQVMRVDTGGVYNHEAPRLAEINLKRMAYLKPGGNWTDIPDDLLPKGMRAARRSDHTRRYGRVDPDGLASTIMTKCDPHWGSYFHYDQDRSFTVREAARLQSFPDRYRFVGNLSQQFMQVGNAVPPLLAEAIGNSIKRHL